MVIFVLSCVCRAIYDKFFSEVAEKNGFYPFGWTLSIIYSAVIFDLLPIYMILLFHSINFEILEQPEDLSQNEKVIGSSSSDLAKSSSSIYSRRMKSQKIFLSNLKDSSSNMGSTINDENFDKSADLLLSDETYKNSKVQEKSIDGRHSVPHHLIVRGPDLYNREIFGA